MNRKPLLMAISALAAASHLSAQSFDVASIKPHAGEVTFSQDPSIRGRRVVGTAITLHDLITYAYAVRYEQIAGGPAWAASEHFELDAKAAAGEGVLSQAEARAMVQSLLADRFRLQVHRETVEVAVYALVAGKGGPKFKPSASDAKPGASVRGVEKGLRMETEKGTMEQLAGQLSHTAGRPVFDRTGLNGYYAYTLEWFPANRIPPADLETFSMFDALQIQLGLRLESAKGPFEKLFIDRAERPAGN